jgi:glycosyltransferase involved in cell wall biosynthesis
MGGMERASCNIANALLHAGCEVRFLALFPQERFFHLDNRIPFSEPNGFNDRRLDLIKSLRWIRKGVQEVAPDIVLVYNKFYGAIAVLALTGLASVKVIVSERSSPLYRWPLMPRVFNKIVFGLWKPHGLIAQTKRAMEYQQTYYGPSVPIVVIPNVVRPIQHFSTLQREKVFLAIGRLNDHLKGFDRLLRAFSKVHASDWSLWIAGGVAGQDAQLDKIIADLGIGARVKMLGKVADPDSLFAQASIFVMPSRSEGFPNALAEAMAAGMACISFDFVAGPSDLIQDGVNGLLVTDGEEEALTKAMGRLAENEVERKKLGNEALHIADKLSESAIAGQHLQFFEAIMR